MSRTAELITCLERYTASTGVAHQCFLEKPHTAHECRCGIVWTTPGGVSR